MKWLILLLILTPLCTALEGTIYNEYLEVETDVVIEVDSQKFLSKDGYYSLDIAPGNYTLTARKGFIEVTEEIEITNKQHNLDIFLLPDFNEEEELWKESQLTLFTEEKETNWAYPLAILFVLVALIRFFRLRKRHGSLKKFRQRVKAESAVSNEEMLDQPKYLEEALKIIEKHDGRITQKDLRKEMLYLSEAKVSLIITELEHKGELKKIKKGRGNILIRNRS